jgi:hypothetical protein
MPSSPTPGKQYSTCQNALYYGGFHYPKGVTLPIGVFEAQYVQLMLTACCLGSPVLNLWDYSRRPRVLYPVAGLPYRSGIHTRWNIRPRSLRYLPGRTWVSQAQPNLRIAVFMLRCDHPDHAGLSENSI